MAVCEIWDVRGRLDHPIDYAENPEKTVNPKYTEADLQAMVDVMEYATNKEKTEQRFFVTGVNCDPTTARDETTTTKQICGCSVSVLMSFAVSMPCLSSNTQAARKSPMPFTKPKSRGDPRGIMLPDKRWMKLSANHLR